MIKRVIDISEKAYLHVEHRQLCVDKEGKTVAKLSIEDLGILILQHPAITITQSVVVLCQKNNVAVLFCDERHLPLSIVLPLWSGHSLHTKVVREQTSSTLPRRKALWQQIIKAKILEQKSTASDLGANSEKLKILSQKVKSGDPDNIEAQAAKHYWGLLSGDGFRRDPTLEGMNSVLNYGYSIMRAMVARALVGTGLHPSIGLHHKNQYNGLCLADDVMEPLRPWVDLVVFKMNIQCGEVNVTRETKERLLGLLAEQVTYKDEAMPLMVSVHYLVSQLKKALSDSTVHIVYPKRMID